MECLLPRNTASSHQNSKSVHRRDADKFRGNVAFYRLGTQILSINVQPGHEMVTFDGTLRVPIKTPDLSIIM